MKHDDQQAIENSLLAYLNVADHPDGGLSEQRRRDALALVRDLIEVHVSTRKRERQLITAAEKVMSALERCARWVGTGGSMQQRAYDARDSAVEEWQRIKSSIR